MASNNELPRGLVLSDAPPGNVAAFVTFPASPGISWVLTSLNWSAFALGETISSGIQVSSEIANVLYLFGMSYVIAGLQYQVNTGSWTGHVIGLVGEGITVGYEYGFSGAGQSIIAEAYPI